MLHTPLPAVQHGKLTPHPGPVRFSLTTSARHWKATFSFSTTWTNVNVITCPCVLDLQNIKLRCGSKTGESSGDKNRRRINETQRCPLRIPLRRNINFCFHKEEQQTCERRRKRDQENNYIVQTDKYARKNCAKGKSAFLGDWYDFLMYFERFCFTGGIISSVSFREGPLFFSGRRRLGNLQNKFLLSQNCSKPVQGRPGSHGKKF